MFPLFFQGVKGFGGGKALRFFMGSSLFEREKKAAEIGGSGWCLGVKTKENHPKHHDA